MGKTTRQTSGEISYEEVSIDEVFGAEVGDGGAYEFYRLHRGSGLYLIGNKAYDAEEGDVIIVPNGVTRKNIEGDSFRSAELVRCPPYSIPEEIKDRLREGGPVYRIGDGIVRVDEIIKRLKEECQRKEAYSTEMKSCYARELAITIARMRNRYENKEDKSPVIATALAYIKEHSSEKISLSDVANVCDVSVAYLSRRFKSDLGIGFSDYISMQRLERAEAMLREHPEMSITEVAFSSGFNDSNYFSDKFKKTYGVSPLRYRKEH